MDSQGVGLGASQGRVFCGRPHRNDSKMDNGRAFPAPPLLYLVNRPLDLQPSVSGVMRQPLSPCSEGLMVLQSLPPPFGLRPHTSGQNFQVKRG